MIVDPNIHSFGLAVGLLLVDIVGIVPGHSLAAAHDFAKCNFHSPMWHYFVPAMKAFAVDWGCSIVHTDPLIAVQNQHHCSVADVGTGFDTADHLQLVVVCQDMNVGLVVAGTQHLTRNYYIVD